MKRKTSLFKFKPFSRKQIHILTWWVKGSKYADYDGIIADGAVRSGKTVSMSYSFALWAMEMFNEQNLLVCGKTVGSCRRNVIKPLKAMLLSSGYKVKDRRADNILTVSRNGKNNDFYIFGGKDEGSQDLIQGITAAGAFFDEVALMPESFVNQATARCSVDGSKWWFNCNPAGPSHWFKVKWVDKAKERKLLYQHFTLDDNLSLSERIKERLRNQYTGVFFQRYILGEWALAEGLIYPMYQDAVASVPESILRGKGEDYVISIDYGTQNAFAAILWILNGNTWYAVREYYWSGREKGIQKTDEEYAEDLDKFVGDINAESIETIIDPSAASFIALLRKKGGYKVRKANNDVLNGIRETSTAIHKGLIKIDKGMSNTIREFQEYIWDAKSDEDKPVKENDHAMDSIRYFVKTKHIVREKKPTDSIFY